MLTHAGAPHDEVNELVLDLGRWMEAGDVEREVAARYPWLDEERLAAVWLLARRLHDDSRFVRRASADLPPQSD